MGILGLLGKFLGFTHDELTLEHETDASTTAVLDPPEDEPIADLDYAGPAAEEPRPDEDGWWLPRADLPLPDRVRSGPIDQHLHEHLVRVLKDPHVELPRLPHAAQRALDMLSDESVDFGKLARVVEQDPATSAQILRVANSVAYRGIVDVTRLDLAFARLGRREVRSLMLALSVKGVLIQNVGGQRSRGHALWERAIAAGVIVEEFCDTNKMAISEAFLLGLLHDLGSFAVLRIVEDYTRTHGRKITEPLFERLCDDWHEQIGLRLADEWNLPDPLPELIGNHARPPAKDDPLAHQRSLLQFSEMCCSMLGYGAYTPHDFFAEPCVQRLGLVNTPATWEKLKALPDQIHERVAGF